MNIFVFALVLTISASICAANTCGGISPSSRWRRTERDDQIRMDIDTTSCKFQYTPLYFTSITGGVGHYLLTGINAIYEPTNSGFTIYVQSTDGATANTLMGRSAQWKMQWIGFYS
jgi:hypothetical protein